MLQPNTWLAKVILGWYNASKEIFSILQIFMTFLKCIFVRIWLLAHLFYYFRYLESVSRCFIYQRNFLWVLSEICDVSKSSKRLFQAKGKSERCRTIQQLFPTPTSSVLFYWRTPNVTIWPSELDSSGWKWRDLLPRTRPSRFNSILEDSQ